MDDRVAQIACDALARSAVSQQPPWDLALDLTRDTARATMIRMRSLGTICGHGVLWLIAAACGPDKTAEPTSSAPGADQRTAEAPACPEAAIPTTRLPDVVPAHREVATWLAKLSDADAGAVLVDPGAVESLNLRFAETVGAWRDPTAPESADPRTQMSQALVDVSRDAIGVGAWRDPTAPESADPDRIARDIDERLAHLRARVDAGEIVQRVPGSLAEAERIARESTPVDQFRVAIDEAQLYCVPLDSGLFKQPIDEDFDRNNCSSIHPGELVRVLRRGGGGQWLYVHVGYVVGWLHEAALTPRLGRDDLDRWQSRSRVVPVRDDVTTTDGFRVRIGTSLPIIDRTPESLRVLVPSEEGLQEATVLRSDSVHDGYPPLTRRVLWELLFSELDKPYGWGGRAGERDCSRYLRDAFATFGIQLARHSAVQAQLGTHNLDLTGMPEDDKLALIESWAARGVVLLYMPGHIMLYLGKDGDHHYGISSMSEYLEPCPGGPDTVYRVDRVAVTTLDLGRDTERTAFIQRITRAVVFAPEMLELAAE